MPSCLTPTGLDTVPLGPGGRRHHRRKRRHRGLVYPAHQRIVSTYVHRPASQRREKHICETFKIVDQSGGPKFRSENPPDGGPIGADPGAIPATVLVPPPPQPHRPASPPSTTMAASATSTPASDRTTAATTAPPCARRRVVRNTQADGLGRVGAWARRGADYDRRRGEGRTVQELVGWFSEQNDRRRRG